MSRTKGVKNVHIKIHSTHLTFILYWNNFLLRQIPHNLGKIKPKLPARIDGNRRKRRNNLGDATLISLLLLSCVTAGDIH